MNTVVLALAGMLIAAGAGLIWRRRRLGDAESAIRLVTTRYLGGKRFLTVVEVEGERLLLAVGGERVSLVAHLPPPRRESGDPPRQAEPAVLSRERRRGPEHRRGAPAPSRGAPQDTDGAERA